MDKDSIFKYSKIDFFDNKGMENNFLFDKIMKNVNHYNYKMDMILFCYLNIIDRNLTYSDDKNAFEKVNFHEKLITEKKFKCGNEEWKGKRIISKFLDKNAEMKTWYVHHLKLEGPWEEEIDFPLDRNILNECVFGYFGKKPISMKMKCHDKGKGFTIKIKNESLSTIFMIEFKSTTITNLFSFYLERGKKLTKYYASIIWNKMSLRFLQ